ncbi:MAG: putative multi-domain protein [Parcubacteria group bacterium GW2011_GWB1_40_14]|nr:MAG: putative multi-domain protein [Parcubacteria group bacterium GW2011_GWB1_40_14]
MILQEKIETWVNTYLEHVQEVGAEYHVGRDPRKQEEGYKFVAVDNFLRKFNLDAPNLPAMLEEALEAAGNLVAGVQFLPKRMLILFAQGYEKETREILKLLFYGEEPVEKRMDMTHERIELLNAKRNKDLNQDNKSFIGLRFLSILLGFQDPGKYNAIKPHNWRLFCKFIDPDFKIPAHASPGEQYKIYDKYIDALRAYIRTIPEVDDLRKRLVEGLSFDDAEFRWMAQTVIYIGSRQYEQAEPKTTEKAKAEMTEEDDEEESDKLESIDDFKSETALEAYIARNWKSIPYLKGFELKKGSAPHGGQYPAGAGRIDLLGYSPERKTWLVIELKKRGNPNSYATVGQIQTYMGYISGNLVKEGDSVRGLIITGEYDENIALAVSQAPNVGWLAYSVRTQYVDFSLINPQGEPRGFDDLFDIKK